MRLFVYILCSTPLALTAGTSYTWTGAMSNVWGLSGNWTPTTGLGYPKNVGDGASFPVFANTPIDLTVGSPFTVGSIAFSATSGVTLQNGALNLSASSGNATITATTAGHEIQTPMTLISDLTTAVSTGMNLMLTGAISGSSTLTAGGAGTTFLNNVANTYTGITTVSTGILQLLSGGSIAASPNVVMTAGTFQAGGAVTTLLAQSFALGGTSIFDSNGFVMTIPGVISGTALTKIGTNTLALTGTANTYSGTIVNAGTLNIVADGSLGAVAGSLALNAGTTLQAGAAFSLSSSRSVVVTGATTIDTNGFSPTIAGPITGTGSITKINAGTTLFLTGTNSYTGGTTVSTGTLQGTTSSLQGAITIAAPAILTFSQSNSGTYAGAITGIAGSTLNLQGGGTFTFTGTSVSPVGTTLITSSNLIVNGNFSSTLLTVDSASSLGGTGTVVSSGGILNQGQIIPGLSGVGTLTVTGNVNFLPGSLVSDVLPLTNGLLNVSGTATLTGGTLSVQPDQNDFYGLTKNYTLVNAGVVTGPFLSVSSTNPKFSPTATYTPTQVLLLLTILRPFLGFPFANANERAVGNNIDELNVEGLLSPDMVFVINALTGQDVATVDSALDQMHPAALSALAELQTELGGQLLSVFHRAPSLACICTGVHRLWVEPFGNWLHERSQGMEIGFKGNTRGVAFGYDDQFFGCWTLGIGGAYNKTDLKWSLDRGHSYIEGAYGSLYTDLVQGDFYLGLSAFAGRDWYDTSRHIHFTTIDRQASSHSHGLDLGGQLTTAYFFGTPSCLLYPYATVDFLYLNNTSFSERGAESLDLNVDAYKSSTLRVEAGGAWKFVDRNRDETVCISPLLSIGYVLEKPMHRDLYRSKFTGMPIAFKTRGWGEAWQLLNLQFGLAITYRCLTLDSQYGADISPEGGSPFFNQRANGRLSFSF